MFILLLTLNITYADISPELSREEQCKLNPQLITRLINCPESYPAEYLIYFLKNQKAEAHQLANTEKNDGTKSVLFGFGDRDYALTFDKMGKILEFSDNSEKSCYGYEVTSSRYDAVCKVKFKNSKPSADCRGRVESDPVASGGSNGPVKNLNCKAVITAMHSCFLNTDHTNKCKSMLHLEMDKPTPNPKARPFPSSEDGIADLPDSDGKAKKSLKQTIR